MVQDCVYWYQLAKQYNFLFYYQTHKCSYQTLSLRASRVLITHQLHQWLMFAHSLSFLFHHHLSITCTLTLTTSNYAHFPGNEPLSATEECRVNQQHLTSKDSAAVPLLFQRDVGWLIFIQQRELGRSAKKWETEKNERGPRNWEAHPVHHEINHNGKLWSVSPILHSILPPLITLDTSSYNNNGKEDSSTICNNNNNDDVATAAAKTTMIMVVATAAAATMTTMTPVAAAAQ